MNRTNRAAHAAAELRGSAEYPNLRGTVSFDRTRAGTLVTAEVFGLPADNDRGDGIFAFHIHSGESCTGAEMGNNAFPAAGVHYNPDNMLHPYHAGDMPPLFGNHGHAYLSFLTDRFDVDEIRGHVVIIHRNADDFTTQPSGNAGTKIACGKIL